MYPTSPVPVDQFGGSGGDIGELVQQAEATQHLGRVGGLGHRRTDLGEFGGGLVDVRVDTLLAKSQCQGKTADASADDCDAKVSYLSCEKNMRAAQRSRRQNASSS